MPHTNLFRLLILDFYWVFQYTLYLRRILMNVKRSITTAFFIFTALITLGANKIPFPENIPIEHFSYFHYPTDVLGFKDSREGAEITPEGYIYTGYTELIFLQGNELAHSPLRKHYWLEKEYLPIHYWVHTVEQIEYHYSAFAAPLRLNPDNNLVVFLKVTITNRGDKKKTSRFAAGTRYWPDECEGDGYYSPARNRFRRPETPLRIGLYEQEGERFIRKWNFEFKNNALLRDGKILYTFSSKMPPELFSYRGQKAEPGKPFKQPLFPSSPVGLALFSNDLNPGESVELFIKMPYTPITPGSPEAAEIASLNFNTVKEKVVRFWEDILSRGMQVELPEAKPLNVYKASLIYQLIARDKIDGYYVQKVNEFHYDAFWLRDSAYFVRSYDLGGYYDIAKECLEFFFRWQREDGNFLSQGGQYDGWGQTLWAMGQHYRLTRDRVFGEKCLDAIMKAAVWMNKRMDEDPLGIMPVTTPGDNENIEDAHLTGHNIWALAGLKNAVLLAEGLGKQEETETLKSLYKRLKLNFHTVLRKTLKRTGNYIPPALDRDGGQDWGNMMAVYPEEILPPRHPAVTETLARTRQKYSEKIMTYMDGQYLHHYLTMKNTETRVVRGDREDALEEFYAVLAHTGSTQTGFEFTVKPWSDRDFYGNLAPHGWFAAKYRNLLRSMLIRERDDILHLLSVVSPAWAVPGEFIRVKNAPTYFGKVSFIVFFKDDGMELEIEPEFFQSPQTVAVHLPYFVKYTGADTGEFKDNTLFISPQTRKVSIYWQKKENVPFFSFKKMVHWLREEYGSGM